MDLGLPKAFHPDLESVAKDELLTSGDVERVRVSLTKNKTLDLSAFKVAGSHLVTNGNPNQASMVWVRENMFAAFALYTTDRGGTGTKEAIAIVNDVATYFLKHAARFDDVIAGTADPNISMERPHVRLNGNSLEELEEYWNHKQNDALGYFLWMRCKLCAAGKMRMTGDHLRLLGLMLEYLVSIEYWRDEDNGHWEEVAKVSASSVGAVLAGAKEFKKVLDKHDGMIVPCADGTLEKLLEKGEESLVALLPNESDQRGREREFDSALLFLAYPLQVVDSAMARTIVQRVEENLTGDIGVRRYNGDGFWCKNFKLRAGVQGFYTKVAFNDQEIAMRNKLAKPGEEAQWTIFDSVMSTIYGNLFKESGTFEDLQAQQRHFLRSVAQVTGPDAPTGPWVFPECYYLCDGAWTANDAIGSVWAVSNFLPALQCIEQTLEQSREELRAEFHRFDEQALGHIDKEDLMTVLTKLDEELHPEDLALLLRDIHQDGKIHFDKLLDDLFKGKVSSTVKKVLSVAGLKSPAQMTPDELTEFERVATDALGELKGELEGEYFPLANSSSYLAKPGGMSAQEAESLAVHGFLFQTADPTGRGVFADQEHRFAVFVNAPTGQLELLARATSPEETVVAERTLKQLETFLREQLKSNNYQI